MADGNAGSGSAGPSPPQPPGQPIWEPPFILAGPILRRVVVEEGIVAVWVATSKPCMVHLDVYRDFQRADKLPAQSLGSSSRDMLKVGERLYIAVVYAKLLLGQFENGQSYSYNLRFSFSDGPTERSLATEGLLRERTGPVRPGLPLGYGKDLLPSFQTCPSEIQDLRLAHGSCRSMSGSARDALAALDELLRDYRKSETPPSSGLGSAGRPHQFFHTGDQIYADDFPTKMLPAATNLGLLLLGGGAPSGFSLDGPTSYGLLGTTGIVEKLPVRFDDRDDQSVQWLPATQEHFPAGRRQKLVIKNAKLTTKDGDSHLLAFGEFCAAYLLFWSEALWPGHLWSADSRLKTHVAKNLAYAGDTPGDVNPFLTPIGHPPGSANGSSAPPDEQGPEEMSPADEQDAAVKADFKKRREEAKKKVPWRAFLDKFAGNESVAGFRNGLARARRVLANVPNYMICDDHEVTDDWNIRRRWRTEVLSAPLGRALIRNALLSYALFQSWGNDPEAWDKTNPKADLRKVHLLDLVEPLAARRNDTDLLGKLDELLGLDPKAVPSADNDKLVPWHFQVPGPRHRVFVLDTRTRRTFDGEITPPRLLDEHRLDDQLPDFGKGGAGATVTFVVSPATALGPPIVDLIGHPALSRVWDLRYAINPAEGPDGTRPHEPGAIRWDTEDWSFHPEAVEGLLKKLASSPSGAAVLLSGDVHFAYSTEVSYYWKNPKGDDVESRIVQLTSSGLRNETSQTYVFYLSGATAQALLGEVGVKQLYWSRESLRGLRPLNLSVEDRKRLSYVHRTRLDGTPLFLSADGWPPDWSNKPLIDPQRPPDSSWCLKVKIDDRKDGERPEAVRPIPMEIKPQATGGKPDLDFHAAVAARHAAMNAGPRRVLFHANVGFIQVFKDPNDQKLYLRHRLLSFHPWAKKPPFYYLPFASVDPKYGQDVAVDFHMEHKVSLAPTGDPRPWIGRRPA